MVRQGCIRNSICRPHCIQGIQGVQLYRDNLTSGSSSSSSLPLSSKADTLAWLSAVPSVLSAHPAGLPSTSYPPDSASLTRTVTAAARGKSEVHELHENFRRLRRRKRRNEENESVPYEGGALRGDSAGSASHAATSFSAATVAVPSPDDVRPFQVWHIRMHWHAPVAAVRCR